MGRELGRHEDGSHRRHEATQPGGSLVVSPGKRTRTAGIDAHPARAAAVVQRQSNPAVEEQQAHWAAQSASWMDVAMRPDLHGAPAQQIAPAELEYGPEEMTTEFGDDETGDLPVPEGLDEPGVNPLVDPLAIDSGPATELESSEALPPMAAEEDGQPLEPGSALSWPSEPGSELESEDLLPEEAGELDGLPDQLAPEREKRERDENSRDSAAFVQARMAPIQFAKRTKRVLHNNYSVRKRDVGRGTGTNRRVRDYVNGGGAPRVRYFSERVEYLDKNGKRKVKRFRARNPRSAGKRWDAGHIKGAQMGGSGTSKSNIFAQNIILNRYASAKARKMVMRDSYWNKRRNRQMTWREWEDWKRRKAEKKRYILDVEFRGYNRIPGRYS